VSIRIGYKASAEQFGPRDLVEYAVRAEELGLDSVTVSDHFLPWRHEGGMLRSRWRGWQRWASGPSGC
jgi:coenzyme F420-dependent glucose-6-phosphate dehydrogenase